MTDGQKPPLRGDALDAALREHCTQSGIDPSCAQFAMQHIDKPDQDWRWCCGSNCDPCVETLGRLVDLARKLSSQGPAH